MRHRRTIAFINTLRPRQTCRYFWFLSLRKISLKFVPKVRINNIPALDQIMAWRRPGDKPLSEPMIVRYWCIYASLGLNELTHVTWMWRWYALGDNNRYGWSHHWWHILCYNDKWWQSWHHDHSQFSVKALTKALIWHLGINKDIHLSLVFIVY